METTTPMKSAATTEAATSTETTPTRRPAGAKSLHIVASIESTPSSTPTRTITSVPLPPIPSPITSVIASPPATDVVPPPPPAVAIVAAIAKIPAVIVIPSITHPAHTSTQGQQHRDSKNERHSASNPAHPTA